MMSYYVYPVEWTSNISIDSHELKQADPVQPSTSSLISYTLVVTLGSSYSLFTV